MGYEVKQSSTAYPLCFLMIDSSDHVSGKTGLSPTVTLSKAGGSFASPSGAVSEIGSGWYKVAGNATDTGTLGPLLLHATATGADTCDDCYSVVAFDPQDTVRLGLTALPNVASGNSGAIPTVGTGTAQINLSGGRADANVTYFNGSAGTFSSGRPEVNASYVGGSAVASGVLPNVAAGSTGGLILIGTGTRDINPNAGGVVITYTGMDDVAAHVWDLAYASHNTAGTFGYQVQNIATGSPPTAAAIASQVRTELTTELGRIDVATSTRLAPTTAGRTLDVSTTGEAGLDFDNIKDASSSHTLTNITVPVVTTTGTVNALANNVITTASINDGAITDAKITVPTPAAGLATGILGMVQQVWRRAFKKTTFDSSTGLLKTYANDGTTVYTTETCTEASNVQTKGAAS